MPEPTELEWEYDRLKRVSEEQNRLAAALTDYFLVEGVSKVCREEHAAVVLRLVVDLAKKVA